ncbi:MAG: hypothetical protein JOZ39_09315, partial [Chloroflexi bacterium]|nr:hypothetical protein [Chloroflexota bacterium]
PILQLLRVGAVYERLMRWQSILDAPNHLMYFTPVAAKGMIERAGFRRVSVEGGPALRWPPSTTKERLTNAARKYVTAAGNALQAWGGDRLLCTPAMTLAGKRP